MYKYHPPRPIVIELIDGDGFQLRQKAADYIVEHQNLTGAQRGSLNEQSFGALAEIVIRNKLGMPEVNPVEHPLGYDILNPSNVKIDVKCRGGEKPFLEEYIGADGLPRESKHNFFARQVHDPNLDAEIFLMTHLLHPDPPTLPGSRRQRKWILYVCGWVSKERVIREGVYLPPGAVSERGREWFPYRAHQIEFYNRNLNGISSLDDILKIEPADVEEDKKRVGDLNLTRVDTLRIGYDLTGRGILKPEHVEYIKKEVGLLGPVNSILHANQSVHVLKWLHDKNVISEAEYQNMRREIPEEIFTGLDGNSAAPPV